MADNTPPDYVAKYIGYSGDKLVEYCVNTDNHTTNSQEISESDVDPIFLARVKKIRDQTFNWVLIYQHPNFKLVFTRQGHGAVWVNKYA
jgi:hypothetical protein